MSRLYELIEDASGKLSSKRITGIAAFVVASIVLMNESLKPATLDANLFQYYCISFAAVLGAGVLERRKNDPS